MANIQNNILKLEPHQVEAYDNVEKFFSESKKAAVIFPTGCGKSFVTLEYILNHPDERILVLSPRNAIKDQMYEYIIRYIGGDLRPTEEIIKEYGNKGSVSLRSAAKKYIPNIECMLYQTISGYGERESINKVLARLKPNIIVIDEMHHLKTKSMQEASRENIIYDDIWVEEDDEKIRTQETEQQNKWGEKFDKFLQDNPQSKLLGLSATPIRTDGANVVERIFDGSIASEISLVEAIEQGIIYPPKYIIPDFLREDELETLLQKIEQAESTDKEELKRKYDELVRNSTNAPGIPELMQNHIEEKDGKYIIYCKDINDMQEKMQKAKEWFGKIDEEPEVYGIHSKEKTSAKQLQQFKKSNSEHLKLMYCVGMIDEGVHLSNISGVIFATKTGSRITYLQRIGRGIASEKDKKQAVVIDLFNNNEILYDSKVQPGYEVNDLELLQALLEWVNNNDGELPKFSEEKTVKERTLAKRLARINNKYLKYIEDARLLDVLDDDRQKQIKKIIELGSTIGMFESFIELSLSEEDKKVNNLIDSFFENIEIKGVRRELRDILTQDIGVPVLLKNTLKIQKWCKENFGDRELWNRKLPSVAAKDIKEKRLGKALWCIRQKIKPYEGKELESIENKEDRKIVEIIRKLDEEYGLGTALKKALQIENWCKETFKDREICDRKLPSVTANNETEKRLGGALSEIRKKIKPYEGKELEDIADQEDREIVKIIRKLDEEYGLGESLKNALQIENWCRETFLYREIWDRRLPRGNAKDETEKRLGKALWSIRQKIKPYEGKELYEISNQEDREIVKIIRKLDEEYGLGKSLKNALQIENWCRETFLHREIWDKRLPRGNAKDETEKRLGKALHTIKIKIKPYEGKELEDIADKEDREIVKIIRKLDEEYGLGESLKNALQIENWCKVMFKDSEIWDKRLPREKAKDETEKRLGRALSELRQKIKPYEEKELEAIANQEDKEIVKIIRKLDEEYGLGEPLKNALQIENWCKEMFKDSEIWDKRLPRGNAKDESEKRLGRALEYIMQKIKPYEGKGLEAITNQEDREIVRIIRKLDEEYNYRNKKTEELHKAKREHARAKAKNKETKLLEYKVEQLTERGEKHEKK
ncbi:MAG: DEAD/DEAH box helicase family protein [Clostridia bacterium]|nr:DEAD/DEAH box helicase family protein [Clostridia bacterium]